MSAELSVLTTSQNNPKLPANSLMFGKRPKTPIATVLIDEEILEAPALESPLFCDDESTITVGTGAIMNSSSSSSSSNIPMANAVFFDEAKTKGYELYSFVHPSTKIWDEFEMGENCFILAGNIIQPFVKIGDNVLIGSNNLISHNTVIENNCFLTSNITLGGHITIGANSFVGLSATINQRVKIGKECIIGAGTLITKDVKDKEVYAENSSKKLPQSSSEIVDIM